MTGNVVVVDAPLVSRWIKTQIRKECVIPNMHDVPMKWCQNPFELNSSRHLIELSPIYLTNHLLWYKEDDLNEKFRSGNKSSLLHRHSTTRLPMKKLYFIAQWRERESLLRHGRKESASESTGGQRFTLPRNFLLTDRFLAFEHRWR